LYQSAWSQQASHQAGTALAQQRVREAASKGFLSESSAADKIPGYTNNPGEMRQESSVAKERVREQLAGTHMRIDANTDPMFVNANRAVDNPDVTLRQQTITSVDEKDYTEQTCIETRDDEFEVIKTSSLDPYYKHFEVYQFYNHCPNHQGWGKSIAQGCITWRRPELLHTKHNPGADYEEIHGMEWKTDAHPDFEFLFQSGKCRLKREVPKEEGRASRMITVDFYKKEETRTDWSISRIDEHREGRSRLKRPEDFGVESFKKVQVFVCSYQSPGNTCKRLRDLGGLELQSTCIERLGGVCVKWQKRYKVPNPGTAKTRVIDMTAGHKEAFNADGSQNDTTYVDNTESAEAIAKLTALKDVGESLPKINTGDPQALTVFTGEDRRCPRQAGMNRCPGGRSKKNVDDQILERKFNEGKCIYIGTYKERWEKNIGTMIGQKRIVTTYCCYDSVLAKVLHQGAIAQGLKPLGEPKSPNCGPLTLGQLQAMDWNRIDLGPFVAEMMSKVNLTAGHVAHKSAATVQSHLGNQMEAVRQARIRGGGNP
jgi:conjugal transfer mating pair stabilization protein TraN